MKNYVITVRFKDRLFQYYRPAIDAYNAVLEVGLIWKSDFIGGHYEITSVDEVDDIETAWNTKIEAVRQSKSEG